MKGLYKRCACAKPERCAHPYWGTYRNIRRSLELFGKKAAHTKTVAQALLEQMRQQIRDGTFEPPAPDAGSGGMSVHVLIEKWFDKHPTACGSISRMRMFQHHFAARAADSLTVVDVEDYLDGLREEAALGYKHQTRKVRSVSTINRHIALISTVYEWALDRDYVEHHPCFNTKGRRIIKQQHEDNARQRMLSVEEEDMILAEASATLRDRIIFALDTGLRLGEQLSTTIRRPRREAWLAPCARRQRQVGEDSGGAHRNRAAPRRHHALAA